MAATPLEWSRIRGGTWGTAGPEQGSPLTLTNIP